MQKSTTKIKKKAGKLKLKEWIRDRSIGSSIKQNFENPFPVIYLFCKTCKHTSVLKNWKNNFRFATFRKHVNQPRIRSQILA